MQSIAKASKRMSKETENHTIERERKKKENDKESESTRSTVNQPKEHNCSMVCVKRNAVTLSNSTSAPLSLSLCLLPFPHSLLPHIAPPREELPHHRDEKKASSRKNWIQKRQN
jgi:hypothetical protein